MAKIEQRIQISRSRHIEDNRLAAELRLKRKDFLKGEVVMLNYYKDQDYRTDVGVMVAIGIADGVGEECYRILSVGGTVQVAGVVELIPDVSSLVHKEVYIWHNLRDGYWYYVYQDPGTPNRRIRKITDGPFIFVDVNSGYRWFYEDQVCKREDDFFSTGRILELLQGLIKAQKINVVVTTDGETVIDPNLSSGYDINLQVQAFDQDGQDITGDCTFYYNGVEINPSEVQAHIEPGYDQRIIIEAVYYVDGIKYSYEGFIDFFQGYNVYLGKVNEEYDNNSTLPRLSTMERRVFKRGSNIKWESIDLEYKKVILLYPRIFGVIQHIYDYSGLDYIRDYYNPKEVVIDGEEYYLYVKQEAITINNFLQDYWFSDKDEGDDSGSNSSGISNYGDISDLIQAWKNRNTPGGLVTVMGNGKIDPTLYDTNVMSSFVEIENFTDGIITNDLVEGALYYDQEGKNLYRATSSDSIVMVNPDEESVIYTFSDNFYTWNGTELIVFSSSISSIKINNVVEIL